MRQSPILWWRIFAIGLAAHLAVGIPVHANQDFDFERVSAMAEALAGEPFKAPPRVPEFLRALDYDTWRSIRYRPDKSLWRGERLPFEAQFFHPGLYYEHSVPMRVVSEYGVGRLAFEKKRFIYPDETLRAKVPEDLGYAGFRLHYPLHRPNYKDEVAAFLGASYFRGVGRNQGYGLSARGLAINTALPSGEEFPYFKAFWLRQPETDAEAITVYALLDSASITGAYRFVIAPGRETVMDVQARLFPRKSIQKLGLAPLTSMFMFGEHGPEHFSDYRPEVHDSDGLSIATGNGEWIWRPLQNPRELMVNSFTVENPVGFGLLQRDTDFASYQDLESRFERRPSAWVAPQGDWGKGHVELVQIPSESEKNDNIVAYWVPEKPVKAGQPVAVAYRLSWQGPEPARPPGGYVTATRVGPADNGSQQPKTAHKIVIDFKGGRLSDLDEDIPRPRVAADKGGEILQADAYPNPVTSGWRLVFHVQAKAPDQPVELRAFLADTEGGALTETWSYTFQP